MGQHDSPDRQSVPLREIMQKTVDAPILALTMNSRTCLLMKASPGVFHCPTSPARIDYRRAKLLRAGQVKCLTPRPDALSLAPLACF